MTPLAFVASVTFGPDALHHQPWQTSIGFPARGKAYICNVKPPRHLNAPEDAASVFGEREAPIVDDWPGTTMWAAANIDDRVVLDVEQYAAALVKHLQGAALVVIDPTEPARLQAMIELGRFQAAAKNNVFAALHQRPGHVPWQPQVWCLRSAVLAKMDVGPDPTGEEFQRIVSYLGFGMIPKMTSTELVETAVALHDHFGF